MKSPTVSIILPTYNSMEYVCDAIESVVGQTYRDWELLIIDDCSTDDTVDLIQRTIGLEDRISIFEMPENSGVAVARNMGLDNANGDYIAFLDSDDMWSNTKLETQLNYMDKNRDSVFSCTAYTVQDFESGQLEYAICPPSTISYRDALIYGNPIGNSTVLIRKDAIGELRIPVIKKRNDFAFWLSILNKGYICHGLDMPLSIYRKRRGSLSSKKNKLIKHQWELYRNILELPKPTSLFYMGTWAISKVLHLGAKKIKL